MELAETCRIAYKGLKNGPHDFDFKVGGALFDSFPASGIKDGACDVKVVLDRAESLLAIDVRITGWVVVECDRCLEDCRIPVDFGGRLLVRFSDTVEEECDGEVMWLSPAETEVDLTQYVYESIVLSLPYQRVHPEGECDPGMLERFRIVSAEDFAQIEARAERGGGAVGAESLSALEALRERLVAAEKAQEGASVGTDPADRPHDRAER